MIEKEASLLLKTVAELSDEIDLALAKKDKLLIKKLLGDLRFYIEVFTD